VTGPFDEIVHDNDHEHDEQQHEPSHEVAEHTTHENEGNGNDREEEGGHQRDEDNGDKRNDAEEGLPRKNLYVANLSYDTTEQMLEETFSAFGEITSVEVIKEPGTSQSRGFAFVGFKNEDEGDAAVAALNGSQINGRTVRVEVAKRARGHPKTPGKYLGPRAANTRPPPRDRRDDYRGGRDSYRGRDDYRDRRDGYRDRRDDFRGGRDDYRGGRDDYRDRRGPGYGGERGRSRSYERRGPPGGYADRPPMRYDDRRPLYDRRGPPPPVDRWNGGGRPRSRSRSRDRGMGRPDYPPGPAGRRY